MGRVPNQGVFFESTPQGSKCVKWITTFVAQLVEHQRQRSNNLIGDACSNQVDRPARNVSRRFFTTSDSQIRVSPGRMAECVSRPGCAY